MLEIVQEVARWECVRCAFKQSGDLSEWLGSAFNDIGTPLEHSTPVYERCEKQWRSEEGKSDCKVIALFNIPIVELASSYGLLGA